MTKQIINEGRYVDLDKDDLKKFLLDYICYEKKKVHNIPLSSKYKNIVYNIENKTKFLKSNSKISFTERVFCILNDLTSQPICKGCDNNVKFQYGEGLKGYNTYCSKSCAAKDNNAKRILTRKNNGTPWHSEESKKKSSESNIETWSNLELKKTHSKLMRELGVHEGRIHSEDEKLKRIVTRKNNGTPWHSEETKEKMSKKMLSWWDKNPLVKKEYSKKMSNSQKQGILNTNSTVSPISQELFLKIFEKLPSENYYFNQLNKEFYLTDNESKKNFYYDFVDIKNKKIIEFNGDYWHGNPTKYNEDGLVKGRKIKEIWEFDNIKNNCAKNMGFETLIIWESEYKKNKGEVINRCVSFLYNNIEVHKCQIKY